MQRILTEFVAVVACPSLSPPKQFFDMLVHISECTFNRVAFYDSMYDHAADAFECISDLTDCHYLRNAVHCFDFEFERIKTT